MLCFLTMLILQIQVRQQDTNGGTLPYVPSCKNFTPIGAIVAEISVTGRRKTQQPIYPSILTYDG